MLKPGIQRWGSGVVALVIAMCTWPSRLRFPFDDTFISFRYAEHLASGHGLVWNVGGAHCEGYTNFLYVLLLAVVRLLTSDLLAASQVIGLVSTVLMIATVQRIGDRLGGPAVGWVSALLCVVTPLIWVNALSGMETSFFMMLVLLSVLAWVTERPTEAMILSLLATLTRPEAGLLALLILLFSLPMAERVHNTLRSFLLFYAIPLAVYAGWKLWYFGYLFPNSFYVKVLHDSVSGQPRTFQGLQYTRLYATSVIALILATLGVKRSSVVSLRLPITFTALLLLFFIFVLPLEGLYDRFLMPTLPLLAVCGVVGVRDLMNRRTRPTTVWIGWGLLAVMHIVITFSTSRTNQAFQAHEDVWDKSMDNIVRVLRSLPGHDSLLVGYGDAGYVIYHSGVNHLDLFALNNTALAHAKTPSERAVVIDRSAPDMLLLPIADSGTCKRLVEDAYGVARHGYTIAATMKAFPYDLAFMVRDASRHAAALHDELGRQASLTGASLLPPPECLR